MPRSSSYIRIRFLRKSNRLIAYYRRQIREIKRQIEDETKNLNEEFKGVVSI